MTKITPREPASLGDPAIRKEAVSVLNECAGSLLDQYTALSRARTALSAVVREQVEAHRGDQDVCRCDWCCRARRVLEQHGIS